MSSVSEEDLDKIAESNQKLREQIENIKNTASEREAAKSREIKLVELQAEEARLKNELLALKDTSKVGAVQAGSAQLLENAKAQLAAAENTQPLAPVDPNTDANGKPLDVDNEQKGSDS